MSIFIIVEDTISMFFPFFRLDMAQFLLLRYEAGISTNITNRKIAAGFRNDSIAYLHFFLERQTGYFLLQYYTPLTLIVMCSWVVSVNVCCAACYLTYILT